MTTKKKRGYVIAAINALTEEHGRLPTPQELAGRVKISVKHAQNALYKANARAKNGRGVAVAPDSALGRLMGPGLAKGRNADEERLIALVSLIGIVRAESLIQAERARLTEKARTGT